MDSHHNPYSRSTPGASRGQPNPSQRPGQPPGSVSSVTGRSQGVGTPHAPLTQHRGYNIGPQYSPGGAYAVQGAAQRAGVPPSVRPGDRSDIPGTQPQFILGQPPINPDRGGGGGGGGLTYADIRGQLGFRPLPSKAASTTAMNDMLSAGWTFSIDQEMLFGLDTEVPVSRRVLYRLQTLVRSYIRPFTAPSGGTLPLRVEIEHYNGPWDRTVDDNTAFWDKLAKTHRHANSLFQSGWSDKKTSIASAKHGPEQPQLFVRVNVPKDQLASIHSFENLFIAPNVHSEMHVEKAIGSALYSVFNDEPSHARGIPPWKCISNTDVMFPVGLKGARSGGCRSDLAMQANRSTRVPIVKDAVVFVAEAKKLHISMKQAVSQMAFAIHCTLIMLVIEHYDRNGWEYGPLNADQVKVALPDNFFIFSIYYWGGGMNIYANYPTIVSDSMSEGYTWSLRCSLLSTYLLSPNSLTYTARFTLYRAVLAVEQHVSNLKHLLCEVDYYPVPGHISSRHTSARQRPDKANIPLFLALHDAESLSG